MNLDQHLGHNDRGDGRRFTREFWTDSKWFEPIFHLNDRWYGVDDTGEACFYKSDGEWYVYSVKQSKEIKMYCPVIKSDTTDYCYMRGDYHSDKSGVAQISKDNIVGWHEITVQVEL